MRADIAFKKNHENNGGEQIKAQQKNGEVKEKVKPLPTTTAPFNNKKKHGATFDFCASRENGTIFTVRRFIFYDRVPFRRKIVFFVSFLVAVSFFLIISPQPSAVSSSSRSD